MISLKNIWTFRPLTETDDVMDNTDCPAQTKTYNAAYRSWRTKKDNDYAFQGSYRKNAYSFVDGKGMAVYQPVNEQKQVWRKLSIVLLTAVVLYFLAECLVPILSVPLLRLAGVEIYYSFQEHVPYGSQYVVLAVLAVSDFLRYLLPILYLNKKLKMPVAVGYPLRIGDGWHTGLAVFGMLLLFAFTDVGLALTDRISTSVNADIYYVMNHMSNDCRCMYLLMELLLVPILSELLLRGAMFQAIRQFGVWFAILVVTLMEVVMTHEPLASVIILPTSLFTGIAVWISGSMTTGIIIHILNRVLRYLMVLSPELPLLLGIPAKWYLLLISFIVGLTGCMILLLHRRFRIQDYHTFLSPRDTIGLLWDNAPIIVIWSIGFMAVLVGFLL